MNEEIKKKVLEIPFKPKFIELIKRGFKSTTIRTLKYHYEGICKIKNTDIKIKILSKRPIYLPRDITEEIIKSEGFKNKEEMLLFFHRYTLPQTMFLYTFEVVE